MKKKFFISTFIFALTLILPAQVAKKSVVEHFTNTRCSICAARNPGFYTNYRNQNNLLHIAYHPSSPYSACMFSQQNTSGNDARTNYYGVYGGTPRLAINGVVIPAGDNYEANALFTPYLGQTSPASIKISQKMSSPGSIQCRVVLTTEAAHTLDQLRLYVVLAEDTVFYNAPNGETMHFDVFRKSFSGLGGDGSYVALSNTVGDSLVFVGDLPVESHWNLSRIYAMAILQEQSSKALVQANSTAPGSNLPTGIAKFKSDARVNLHVTNDNGRKIVINSILTNDLNFTLYDLTGRQLIQKKLEGNAPDIDVEAFATGVYLYDLSSGAGVLKRGKLFFE